MLKVGSKFYTFDELSRRLEEFQELEQVQLWVRDSRTVVAAAKRARRKSLNPALKYAELTYSCVFGGRRPSDQTKIHNQTSAGGCPFKVRLSTSNDGQALVVKEICHEHNHEPGKKLHEEPRRLYKKTQNRTTVRKPVRYIVNKRVTSSTNNKTKSRLDHTESHVQLGQSPFHHLHLHQQQYQQQQQQLKLQLQQHLQQQQQQQQQLRQKQAEVIQLDSPDHLDTPDHLSSPDLSTNFDQLGSLNNSVDQYSYLPPSPISPSLSSGCPVDFEEDERLEPILDLEEALEEALGDLDSVGSMEVDANLRLTSVGCTTPTLVSHAEAVYADDHTGPPPAKRQRGRPRKQSFTGSPPKGEKAERDHSGEPKDGESSTKHEEDFLGFSPSADKSKADVLISRADIAQANAMARQLHVFKPGIDFVPGSRLEVLESRDNNWYQCKIVEVDWGELDILVHYERWSNRFDEWLKMDSTRIRPMIRSSLRKDRRSSHFRVGDKVTARWAADGKRYHARITKSLGDDQYEVLFFDGVAKILRSGALTKADLKFSRGTNEMGGETESPSTSSSPSKQFGLDDEEMMLLSPAATTASSTDSRSSSPEPDQHSADTIKEEELSEVEAVTAPIKKSIFEVEIIDQKRKPKRKAAVEELFQSLKKKRKYEFHGKKEDVPVSPKYPHTSRSATSSPRYQHAVRSTQARKTLTSKKRNRDSICGIEEEGPSMKQAEGSFSGDVPESATCDSPLPPQSTNLVTVELEDGWKKCCTRRTHGTTAGKWDMFYVAPEGKKIRCKNDLHRYCEELGLPFEIEKFDFSVKNMKDAIEAYLKEADSKVTTKTHQPAKDQKELSKDVGLVEVKEEKIEHEDKTAISDPGESSKIHMVKRSEVKKPEVKRLDVKLSDPPRMKIEIPIIPKTENIGMLASPLISPSASPWSPTLTSALPRSLPASAIVHSDEAVKEEPPPPPPPPPPPAEDTAVGSDLTEETPKFGATPPARQKNILKKEPVLAPNEFVVRAEHNEHQCPKDGCGKGFRKENLLQMHIKHYHPEILKKGSSWAPNVADLAYARTVGDHLDLNASPTPASPPLDKALKQETLSKKISRGVVSGSSTDARNKTGEKKGQGPPKGANTSREIKKKDSLKSETEMTKSMSEDEMEPKEELDDYMDDLEEETPVLRDIVRAEDPDYVPCEVDPLLKKKDKKERKRTRSEAKGKKRKSVPSESMSEDDQQETRAVTKYRYSKRKGSAPPKTNVSATSDPFSSEANLSTSPVKKVQCAEEPTNLEVEEDTTDTWVEGAENVSVQETSAEIINCGCGSTEEEGLMLQCDVCLCWQHGACYNIVGEDQVPDKYICSLCDHPRLERSSHKFRHHQDWLKEGRLPRFSFSRTRGDARLEACVRRGHEMTANVLQLSQVLHSLRLKLHIAKEADHPKFVMWHKKWDEREEDSDQSKAATLANTDTVAPLHELMNIVEQDGSDLSPALTNPLMAEPGLMTTGMSSSDEPGATHATSPVEQDEKPNPSGVWDITGQLINVENFSTNSDAQKPGSADVLQKEPADKKKIKEGDAIDSIKGNSNLSVPSIMSGMPDAEKKESGEGNKIHPVTKFDDAEQSPVSEDKDGSTDSQDQSKIISDKSEGEITLQTKANLTLSEGSSKIYDPQKESLDASEAERDLIENSSTLQTTPDSTELELGNQTGLKPPSKQDNLEDKKTEDSKRIDVVKGSAESNKEISMDITEESTHKDISPIKCSPQCQKLESLKSAKLRETSQQESPSSDNVHPEDCICEEIKLQAEEKKMEAFIKEESTDGSDSSLKDNFKSGIVPEDYEMQSTENEGKTESNKKESNVKTSVSKELITTIINEANTPKSEVEIKPTLKEEKTEADVSVLSEAKAPENYIAEGKITKREDGDDTEIAFENLDEMKSDASKDHCISKDNEDNKMTDIETKDKSKPSLERDEGETEEHKLSEVEMSAVQEPSDINEKEGKQSKDLEGIELPQSSVIDAADISQPQDIEGTEDTLDDDDTQLDDGDDLALDLGGLGAAGEGGMPGGSDLAALLSSQTELEQLVTQASSALAPHVPTAGIVQSVPAPIIPEAERIEPVNCKLNLLEHVQVVQSNITKRFDQIEKQLEVLEAEMGLSADTADEECEEDSEERDPATLQARALIKLILNDVNVVKKIAEFTH